MNILNKIAVDTIQNKLCVNYANARGDGEIEISFIGTDSNQYVIEVEMECPDAHTKGFDEARVKSYTILECYDSESNEIEPPTIDYMHLINEYLEKDKNGFNEFTNQCYNDLMAEFKDMDEERFY